MQVIKTALPLKMEVIKRFYEQKDSTFFEIDYAGSELRGEALLNYIGNLELECTLNLEEASNEDVENLLLTFMKSPLIIKCVSIQLEVLDILLQAKGINFKVSKEPLLSEDQKDEFIKKNIAVITRWVFFLDSLWVFACASIEMAETGRKFSECLTKHSFPVIRDRNFVGRSVVTFFEIPCFFEVWFSEKPFKVAYFEHQFEERFTGNKMLYDFFASEKNWLLLMVLHEVDKHGLLGRKPPVEETK